MVIASGRDDAGEEGKRRIWEKRRPCAREAAAARARRPRESRERTVGSGEAGEGEERTKKDEWPRRRRRRII